MRRADVLRAMTHDSDDAVEVVVDDSAALDALTEGLERVRPDTVVVVIIRGPGSVLPVADVVVVANRFKREVVGVIPVDDGSTAVLLRSTTAHELLARVASWDVADRLRDVTAERDELKRRLNRILRSRAYRLARQLARAKRAVASLIHR